MATINRKATEAHPVPRTHEGGIAFRLTPEQELTRSVLACLLWEDSFYEDGEEIASRITGLVSQVARRIGGDLFLAELVSKARNKYYMRHAPLLMVAAMAKAGIPGLLQSETVAAAVQRADELAELLAIYQKINNGKLKPLSNPLRRGLALAFPKFDAYQLAKYNRAREITLRDVMFLTHPKPDSTQQKQIWERLIAGTLEAPDTWEVNISALGKDKVARKPEWERMLGEGRVTGLALLRNLRNMREDGVDSNAVIAAIKRDRFTKVLPFRFISAAKYAPELEPELEAAMLRAIQNEELIPGRTAVLVDVSGSMIAPISAKSLVQRWEAATGLAILAREVFVDVNVIAFGSDAAIIPARHGFALRDAIAKSNVGGGTNIGKAVAYALNNVDLRRLIVITDEQSHDNVVAPDGVKSYMINVAAYKNGVGYGKWTHMDGFSEATVNYIREVERWSANQ